MKKTIGLAVILLAINSTTFAQVKENESKENIKVPAVVTSALHKKYAEAKNVTWEKEDGNYEANWGGKSGEDNSVQFTPSGTFIEIVNAIAVNQLPANVTNYIKQHYNGAKITEAGKVTDAAGKLSYEAEVHGKDITFDENGNFIKAEK
ncbi:MAG: PepSY-like domain-containing protein [Ginsengibacter sp.]